MLAGLMAKTGAATGRAQDKLNEADRIAREFHKTYERLGEEMGLGAKGERWQDLTPEKRELLKATVLNLLCRNVIKKGGRA